MFVRLSYTYDTASKVPQLLLLWYNQSLKSIQCTACTKLLHFVVASNVLVVDENVGNGSLSRQLPELFLDKSPLWVHIDFVDDHIIHIHGGLGEEDLFGSSTVRAIGFAPYHDFVLGVLLLNKVSGFFTGSDNAHDNSICLQLAVGD